MQKGKRVIALSDVPWRQIALSFRADARDLTVDVNYTKLRAV